MTHCLLQGPTCLRCSALAHREIPYLLRSNLSSVYYSLGRDEEALAMDREVYSGTLRLNGEDHRDTILTANNYARSLNSLQRFEEAKSLSHKMMLVARRVLGESNELTLKIRWHYATALYLDPAASLGDLREAVTTLEETVPIVRRVLDGAHPTTRDRELDLQDARAALRAREPPPPTERALRDARAALRATP